ncbi:hypothetical protein BVC80_9059g4 [Macleaya cordata]|uniref:Uncharacterized protein n=1 Tax=Macleaya cordata TaxID=56857 RepID=A0A200RAE5_MACCD|nr:hypothetical protein BVC80_9059g4 [Macleaya cordata]
MGCISSKIITRSRSYQEELNQSFQKSNNNNNNGLPGLEELFISSRNGGRDQFLAHLVCSAAANNNSSVTLKKVQSGNFSTSSELQPPSNKDILKQSVIPTNPDETINSWELMAGLEQEEQQQQQQQQILSSPIGELEPIHHRRLTKKRSKSFHWFIEHDSSSPILEGNYAGAKDHHGSNNNNKKMGILRSRSFHFHTLQEYDEMVEEKKKWLIEAREQGNPEDPVRDMMMMMKVQSSYPNCGTYSSPKICDHSVDEEEGSVLEIIEEKDNKYYGLMEEDAIKKDNNRWIEQEEEDPAPASKEAAKKSMNAEIIETKEEGTAFTTYTSSLISATDVVVEEDVPSEGKLLLSKKGLKRKAVAKELTSLSIPMPPLTSTIEFPGSLGERLDHDEVLGGEQQVYNYYSSEAYVTPKFGSFNSLPPVQLQRKKCSSGSSTDDSAVFESEMVAAFEEAMQQLQIEEDCALKQIGENLDHEEDHGITQPPRRTDQ